MSGKPLCTKASFLISFILLAGSASAQAQGGLPQAPDYRGEVRRGADGKLTVIPAPEPAGRKPAAEGVSEAT